MLYTDLEQQEAARLRRQEKIANECISCPQCGCQWLESVSAQRFQLNHNVIVGQDVPPQPGSIPYKLLRCVRCSNLIEPRIIHNTRDLSANSYDEFLDTMEGHNDERSKEQREFTAEERVQLRTLIKSDSEETNEVPPKE